MSDVLIDECEKWLIDEKPFIESDAMKSLAREAWQAARDNYAPKLSESQAERIIAETIMKESYWESKDIIKALGAAGMKFKEKSNG